LFSKLVERINADKSLAGELPDMPWKLLRGSFAGCLDKQDKEIMRRGKSASSLAYIGRAMYWALVEQRYEEDLQSRKSENTPAPTRHRKELRRVLRSHNGLARALKISDLKNHVPKARNGALFEVLEATQKWIREKGPTFSSWESGWDYSFREIFETAERRRKGSRAKLLRKDERARDNRHAAGIDRLPGASPLLYRWSNVRRFLRDLVNHEEPERQ